MKILAALLILAAPAFAQGVKWEHDLATALKRAKAEKKMVFVDVWAEWCPPCQFLKSKIFPTAAGEQALAGVIPVSLMVQTKDRKDVEAAKKDAQRFDVEAFPTLVMLNSEGKEIRRKVGAFQTPESFAAWIAQK